MAHRTTNQKRWRRINSQSEAARWRHEPASRDQLRVLARITRETGRSFSKTITKGEASDIIGERFERDSTARKAHRRAQRKRQRQ